MSSFTRSSSRLEEFWSRQDHNIRKAAIVESEISRSSSTSSSSSCNILAMLGHSAPSFRARFSSFVSPIGPTEIIILKKITRAVNYSNFHWLLQDFFSMEASTVLEDGQQHIFQKVPPPSNPKKKKNNQRNIGRLEGWGICRNFWSAIDFVLVLKIYSWAAEKQSV